MRELRFIYSQRRFANYPSFRIVYEWEDIIARELGLKIQSQSELHNIYHRRFEKNGLVGLYHAFAESSPLGLRFVMEATTEELCHNNKNSIPVIIDFWLEDSQLQAFYHAYRNVPLMLITSREVYDYLVAYDCPIPIEHWALSFPDQYISGVRKENEKKYDFCVFGRPNPFFLRLLDEYSAKHPAFEYVLNQGTIDNRSYITNKGRFICSDVGRESYLSMISSTRVSCYTTPGIDESKRETSRFNQVTPRVFEMLSNECHVIGHYPNNPDTEWYDLKSVVPNVDNYEQFESQLNYMLSTPFEADSVNSFLNAHKTSLRAKTLREILTRNGIMLR